MMLRDEVCKRSTKGGAKERGSSDSVEDSFNVEPAISWIHSTPGRIQGTPMKDADDNANGAFHK